MGANRFAAPGSATARLFAEASALIPGGTSKANFNVRPHPLYLTSGRGARVTDLEGVERLDCINNFTALIHGHAFAPVIRAVTEQLERGTAFSSSTPEEIDLARELVARVPSVERIRFGNSGTEGVMMAIKAARAYTGRDRIAKFEGAYHGYYDDVQVSFSSAAPGWGGADEPASLASSGGLVKHRVQETLVLPWNDLDNTERLLMRHRGEIAAVLVDPLSNRMGFIPPAEGFLARLREITRALGILVIFDEVISFRVARGGAQSRYGGDPDLTAFGKIIGGGFPVGATAGRAAVMDVFDPNTSGPRIASGGTFSANPVSMVAGLVTLRALDDQAFDRLADMGARLRGRLNELFGKTGVPGHVTGDGSLFKFVMTVAPLSSYRDTMAAGVEERMGKLFMHLLDAGMLVNTNGLACLSTVMTEGDLDTVVDALQQSLSALA
jgi:glutamate-1-semialdehyde 2,1-aminomutase